MNKENKRLYFYAFIFVKFFALLLILAYIMNNAGKRIALLESAYLEMGADRTTLVAISEDMKILKKRAEEGKGRNFIVEVERIAADSGIGKGLKKTNYVTKKKEGAFNSDDYELKLEGVDINSAVNFIYRISNAGLLIKIKKCSTSISFENPNLLNINLLVSHMT